MSKELIDRLISYIPNGDGHNSQYANDLADAVALLEAKAAPVGELREAFEAWAASVGYHTERDMFQREKYQSSLTWELWRVWQAGAAYQRQSGVVMPDGWKAGFKLHEIHRALDCGLPTPSYWAETCDGEPHVHTKLWLGLPPGCGSFHSSRFWPLYGVSMIAATPSAPATVQRVNAQLLEALEELLDAYSKPDDRICCAGTHCGCMGATKHQLAEHDARAAIAAARQEGGKV